MKGDQPLFDLTERRMTVTCRVPVSTTIRRPFPCEGNALLSTIKAFGRETIAPNLHHCISSRYTDARLILSLRAVSENRGRDQRIMARDEPARRDLTQQRLLGGAARIGARAAGAEPAAGRRRDRDGQVSASPVRTSMLSLFRYCSHNPLAVC